MKKDVVKLLNLIEKNLDNENIYYKINKVNEFDNSIIPTFESELGISLREYIDDFKTFNSIRFLNSEKDFEVISRHVGLSSSEELNELYLKTLNVNISTLIKLINGDTMIDNKIFNNFMDNLTKINNTIYNCQEYKKNKIKTKKKCISK